MTELLTELAEGRRRLLARADELTALWQRAQSATGSPAPGEDDAEGLVTADLSRIREELHRRTFTIGLFGLIKRGKSTLLNALLGAELSPTHVTPETAVPVYVEYGDEPRAVVHLVNGEQRDVAPDEVGVWTSQKENPRNRRGVTHLRWTHPSGMLRNGVRIVDTPGLDDADADDLYTRRTIQELEAADAGILVFLSPPTVGATEMAFLREVTAAQLRKTLLVANLYPQQFHDELARTQVVEYVRRQVSRESGLKITDVEIHAVCAEDAWQARRDGDDARFELTGGAGLLRAVEEAIAANTGRRALQRVEAALNHTVEVARASLDLQVQALAGRLASGQQEQVREHSRRLTNARDDVVENRLRDVAATRTQLDALVNGLFLRTRAAVKEAGSVAELEGILTRFSREVVVTTEDAFQQLHHQLIAIHAESTRQFDAGVASTLHELGAVRPGLGVTGTGQHTPAEASALGVGTNLQGAAVGGILAGGASFALVGSLLGPIGLVVGAVVGWRLGSIVRAGRELRPLRAEVDERIVEIGDEVLGEFDRRLDDLVAAVRTAAQQRRLGFAADLRELLEMLERLSPETDSRTETLEELREILAEVERLGASRSG